MPATNFWRRRMQLRLGTLLILMTVCCLGLVYRRVFIVRFERQAQAARRIEAMGGQVAFETAQPAWLALIAGRNRYRDVVMVHLERCRINDRQLLVLRDLPKIRNLYLAGNPITSDGLKEVSKLALVERLSLWNTRISDRGMREIAKLQNLQVLDIQQTQISDAGLQHLARHRNLQELLLGEHITADGLTSIGTLPRLKSLVLTTMEASAFARLGNCPIENIGLTYGARMVGTDLQHLLKLKRLQVLPATIYNCSDEDVKLLEGLKELEAIELHGTLSDRSLDTLRKLPKLRWLHITGHITPAGILRLQNSKCHSARLEVPSYGYTFWEVAAASDQEIAQGEQNVTLINANLSTNLSHLANASEIRELKLMGCELNNAAWQCVCQTPHLQSLQLLKCSFQSTTGDWNLDGRSFALLICPAPASKTDMLTS